MISLIFLMIFRKLGVTSKKVAYMCLEKHNTEQKCQSAMMFIYHSTKNSRIIINSYCLLVGIFSQHPEIS